MNGTYLNSPKVTPAIPPAKPIAWTAVIIAAIAAGTIISVTDIVQQRSSRPAAVIKSDELIQRPGGPVNPLPSTPAAPAPVVIPDPPVQRAAVVEPIVRRAELVNLPIGWTGSVTMPDRREMIVTYRGTVPTFDDLPRHPQWSDMYIVAESNHAWIWMLPSGFSAPAWVDP